MSNWTHVAGVIRVDSLRQLNEDVDFDKLIGKEFMPYRDILNNDSIDDITAKLNEAYADLEADPSAYLPMGSEGSLHKSVWTNPEKSACAAYVVTIWGDLRDHYNANEIVKWFKGICNKFWIRQACITVENEWNETVNWVYERGEMT